MYSRCLLFPERVCDLPAINVFQSMKHSKLVHAACQCTACTVAGVRRPRRDSRCRSVHGERYVPASGWATPAPEPNDPERPIRQRPSSRLSGKVRANSSVPPPKTALCPRPPYLTLEIVPVGGLGKPEEYANERA